MSGDHNQYQKPEPPCKTGSQCIGGKCERCAEPEPHQHGGRIMTMREIMEAEDCEPPPPQPEQEQDGKCQNCDGSGCVACDARHLPQPEQQPAAWGIANTRPTEKQSLMMVTLDEPEPSHLVVPLYTAPPQREWQGLTDEEYDAMAEDHVTDCYFDTLEYAKAIEAKLKEKNT